MNVKMLDFIAVSALLLAALYPVSSTAAGKEEKCTARRPLSVSEKSHFAAMVHAIQKAVPPAPEGWTFQESDCRCSEPVSICDTPGVPLASTCQVSYINEKKILESIQKYERGRSAARLESLAAEMSDAAEKGDSRRLQKLQKELDSLTQTPAGKMTARITVLVNHAVISGNIRGGTKITLPGARYAYLIEDKKGKRVAFYLGRWNRKGEFGLYPEIAASAPNVAVQVIEVVIEGDIAEQLAESMNLKVLNSLIK